MEGSGGVGRGAEGAQQLNFYGALVGIFELNFARLADLADARARLSRFRRLVDHNAVAEHVLEVSSGEEADQLAWRQPRAVVAPVQAAARAAPPAPQDEAHRVRAGQRRLGRLLHRVRGRRDRRRRPTRPPAPNNFFASCTSSPIGRFE